MIDRIENIITKNKRWIILFLCLIIFLKLAEDVFGQEILKCDTLAYKYIVEKLRTDKLTTIMKIITKLGNAISIITLTILLVIFIKNKKIGICITSNMIIITVLNVAIKNLMKRQRPEGFRIISETGYSFPSGHSMVSTAFYGLLIYFSCKNIKNKKLKYFVCTVLGFLIIAICISRIYLGVHYGSDVIAGFVLSIAYLIGFTAIFPKLLEME